MNGLINIGNTCYMNSALQLLFNSDGFKNTIKKSKSPKIKLLLNLYEQSKTKCIAPIEFKKMMGDYNKMFKNNNQQDSFEFLIYLFELIEKECNNGLKKVFEIETNVNIKCKMRSCLNEREHKEYNYFLILPLTDNLNDSYREYKTIVKFTDNNKIDCDKCKNKTPSRKLISTEYWPEEIIIILKRFNNFKKLNDDIFIPINWRHNYRLIGGIIHSGGLNGGHYVYFGYRNNNWYLYNDSNVSIINDLEPLLKKAYILHYKKF